MNIDYSPETDRNVKSNTYQAVKLWLRLTVYIRTVTDNHCYTVRTHLSSDLIYLTQATRPI